MITGVSIRRTPGISSEIFYESYRWYYMGEFVCFGVTRDRGNLLVSRVSENSEIRSTSFHDTICTVILNR